MSILCGPSMWLSRGQSAMALKQCRSIVSHSRRGQKVYKGFVSLTLVLPVPLHVLKALLNLYLPVQVAGNFHTALRASS